MKLNASERQLYDVYTETSHQRGNVPKMDELVLVVLGKLVKFFETYPHIEPTLFFEAPYVIHPEENAFPLEYFIDKRAIRAYSSYMKLLELENPDTSNSLERLQKSLIFVTKYCSENGITLEEYEKFFTGTVPEYLTHLKLHKITFYTLHTLKISNPKIETQILDFIFKDFYITFQKTKNSFFHSKKMKLFSGLAFKKLSDKLRQELTNTI